MLEGVFIGLLGAIIPILVVYFGYNWIYSGAADFLPAMVSMREPFPFIWQCAGIMIALGCGVGLIWKFCFGKKVLEILALGEILRPFLEVMMKKLIMIGGTMGVGKTTVSHLLKKNCTIV